MLTRLHLQNFTVFADANFEFSPGLNVLVGTNGTGKSHVLKVGYAMCLSVINRPHRVDSIGFSDAINDNLGTVFLSGSPHYLVRGQDKELPCSIRVEFERGKLLEAGINRAITFDGVLERRVLFKQMNPVITPLTDRVVFIPAKEVLSFYYGFLSLYEKREVDYDLTYPNLCRDLSTPLLRKTDESVSEALTQLQAAMGGTVKIEGNRFVFVPNGSTDSLPINLYAEGLRKFGTLWQLLRNGSLTPETTLFWDEPEANLNPALLKKLAAVLAALARQGFQIILATHSLFLLKELHILSRDKKEKKLPIRYFGLSAGPDGATQVETQNDFQLLNHITALETELTQSDELTVVFAEEDKQLLLEQNAKSANR